MEKSEEDLLTIPNVTTDCEECGDEGLKEKKPNAGWSKTNFLWRGLNFAMACFFAMATYVQLNDPDPLVWMVVWFPYIFKFLTLTASLFMWTSTHSTESQVINMFVYAVPACLCISTAFSPEIQDHVVWQSLATADIVGSLAGAIYLATAIRPQMQKDAINNPLVLEEGREMSGLIIVMFWISLCKFVTWYSQRKGNVPILFWISILMLCFVPFSLWAYCYRNLDRKILPQHCKDML